jgi:hypothetical protein
MLVWRISSSDTSLALSGEAQNIGPHDADESALLVSLQLRLRQSGQVELPLCGVKLIFLSHF